MEQRLDPLRQEQAAGAPFRRIEGDLRLRPAPPLRPRRQPLPPAYGTLGLPPEEFHRHIAYDIGAAGVTERLARSPERSGAAHALSRGS